MAIFYAHDYYPGINGGSHLKAMCKVSFETGYLHFQFYKTGCGMFLATCEHGHFHTPKRVRDFPEEVEWRPLPEFCLNQQLCSEAPPLEAQNRTETEREKNG